MITDIIKVTQLNNYDNSNHIIKIAKGKYELITIKNIFKKLKQKFRNE